MNIVVTKLPEQQRKEIQKAKREFKKELGKMGWGTLYNHIGTDGKIHLEKQFLSGSSRETMNKIAKENPGTDYEARWQEYLIWVMELEKYTGKYVDNTIAFLTHTQRKNSYEKYNYYEVKSELNEVIVFMEVDWCNEYSILAEMNSEKTLEAIQDLIIKFGTQKRSKEQKMKKMFNGKFSHKEAQEMKAVFAEINEEKVEALEPLMNELVGSLQTILQEYQGQVYEILEIENN